MSRRLFQKLAAKYYGPFEVTGRVGKVAYRLQLPEVSKVHPVFHVSQLKPVIGTSAASYPLPPVMQDELVVEPTEIIDTRYDEERRLEVLLKWNHLPDHEASWLKVGEVKQQFPNFSLEDKLNLANGGIDMPHRVYVRRKNRGEEQKEDSKSEEIELARDQ